LTKQLRNLLSIAILAALPGCGGGTGGSGSPTTPPVPTPEPLGPATRTVIDVREFALKKGAGVFYNQDKLPEGTLDVTMNWNNGDIPFSIYLTPANSCPDTTSLRNGACQVLAQSNDRNAKPKTFTYAVPAGKPSVAVWVVNEGGVTSEGTVEVGLTSREKPTPPVAGNPNDPQAGLADGPVAIAFIKVRSVDVGGNKYRDPFQDRDGYWVLHKGEFVVFDLTQKNGSGAECKWIANPTWDVDDPGYVFILKGSSQPFLLRTDVDKEEGFVNVQGMIDGVKSNILKIKVTKDK
jgi:hypothetical protein